MWIGHHVTSDSIFENKNQAYLLRLHNICRNQSYKTIPNSSSKPLAPIFPGAHMKIYLPCILKFKISEFSKHSSYERWNKPGLPTYDPPMYSESVYLIASGSVTTRAELTASGFNTSPAQVKPDMQSKSR